MLYLQRCHEDTELFRGRNEACCFYFPRVTSCKLWGPVLAFPEDKARPSAGTKKPALPTSIHSPWMFHVQPTQAQHMLPGDSLLPFLFWCCFDTGFFLPIVICSPYYWSWSSQASPAGTGCRLSCRSSQWGVASPQHRWHCQAALLLLSGFFFPKTLKWQGED